MGVFGTVLAVGVGVAVAVIVFFIWRTIFRKVGLIGWIAIVILFFVGLGIGFAIFGSL